MLQITIFYKLCLTIFTDEEVEATRSEQRRKQLTNTERLRM